MIVWLASYPRSGNTFARIALNHFFDLQTETAYPGEEFFAEKFLGFPASHMDLEHAANAGQTFIVKTHDLPAEERYPAIYLVRDGRDVLVSYAHYALHTQHGIPVGSDREAFLRMLEELIVSDAYFGGWSQNVLAWTRRVAPTATIRFEDLLADPAAVLKGALAAVGLSPRAVNGGGPLPSFESLHEAFPWFFRKGRAGAWRAEMPDRLHRLFWSRHEEAMKACHYAFEGADAEPGNGAAGPGLSHFFSSPYQEHNRARLAHLESLGLPLSDSRVLELGSGPGDHTGFYVERRCTVVSVDARQDCLDVLKQRFPDVQTVLCDLNAPAPLHALGAFDVIHCYGILYHLEDPAPLVAYMGEACSRFAIVETCVSPGKSSRVEIVSETHEDYTQSSSGRACRPSRTWVFEELGRAFPYVYLTRTQPAHPEFPIDWNALENAPPLIRSVFVASKEPLDLPALSPVLLDVQERFDQPAYIERLEATAAQRQRELEAKEAALTELHREATRRGEALDQTTAAIEQQQQRLTMLEAAAAERLTELHAKEAALADLLAEAERRREALELTTTANQQLHQRVATQQHQLHTLQTTAAERLAQLQAKEAALIELHGEMERATSTIGEQQRHLETLRSAAAERLAELQAKEAVLRELHGEAERRREALERAAATVREQQQRLEALEATTAEQQRELDELRKTAAYLEEQRQTLEAERNQLRRENYALTLTVRRFEQETFTAFLQRRWTQRK